MSKTLRELAKALCEALPKPLQEAQADLETKFHKILQTGFNRLDLVTREEFDTQVAVLQRTRRKLEKLERKIAELEKSKTHRKT